MWLLPMLFSFDHCFSKSNINNFSIESLIPVKGTKVFFFLDYVYIFLHQLMDINIKVCSCKWLLTILDDTVA